jgi:uncharacterized MAPEG superfamily protein
MSNELTLLALSVALLIVLIAIQATAAVLAQGIDAMAGPRDNLPEPTVFQARTKRIVDNHREGLTVFAPLVLIAALNHVHSGTTVLACQLFLGARVAHAIIYLFGIPKIRPLAFAGSLAATVMMLIAIL